MESPRPREAWQLKATDFGTKKVHAEQDWRFQMFFEYLRISPSFALATTCSDEGQLAKLLGDGDRAAAVWKTYSEVGNVFSVLYREWWLSKGIGLFGIRSARPCVESVLRMPTELSTDELTASSATELGRFIQTRHLEQGMPDSLLVSIPLGMKRMAIMKQVKAILDSVAISPTGAAKSRYLLEKNKLRQKRLMIGLRLVYMRAARPKEELWRSAARAKISPTHNSLDPVAKKKDSKSAEARRMLTIMASRLLHDTLVVAENAARGVFPSLVPAPTMPFDFEALGKRLKRVIQLEKMKKAKLLAMKKPANVK